MKKRAKIIATSTVAAITFLIISAYHTESTSSPISPPNCPASWVVEVGKTYTPPLETKLLVGEEMPKISTQIEEFIEPPTEDSSTPQTTENMEPTNTPTTPTQTATKPTKSMPSEPSTPKMGDTRVVNGQKQSYFLGFGWIEDKGENECIYVEGMYENGNKIGIMGQSDGDINKMVGTMD